MKDNCFNILLIEDDPLYAEGVKHLLTESKGVTFHLEHVDRLSKALDRISKGGLDLILTDLGLPDSNRLSTIKSIYAQAPQIPIVVLTGFIDEEYAVKAVQAGAQDYLFKGKIDRNALVRAMRYAIERHRWQQTGVDDASAPLRVILVDDSLIALGILKKMLHSSADIQVVATANNGKQALSLISQLQPDVICTDLEMPIMNGLELVKEVMAKYPRPVLVVSNAVQEEDNQNIFQLLEAGAVDIFAKPRGGLRIQSGRALHAQELIDKVKAVSRANVLRKQKKSMTVVPPKISTVLSKSRNFYRIIVIGASIGGPKALKTVLSQLPSNFSVPIICVQIISKDFLKGFITWLESDSKIKVEIAQSGEKPRAGTIYLPPEDLHLELDSMGNFICSAKKPPYRGYRPSITVTFRAVANFYGKETIGILLTGLGCDGVEGMETIAATGGLTIVQDEESSITFDLPKQAIELGAAQKVLPLSRIAAELNKIVS